MVWRCSPPATVLDAPVDSEETHWNLPLPPSPCGLCFAIIIIIIILVLIHVLSSFAWGNCCALSRSTLPVCRTISCCFPIFVYLLKRSAMITDSKRTTLRHYPSSRCFGNHCSSFRSLLCCCCCYCCHYPLIPKATAIAFKEPRNFPQLSPFYCSLIFYMYSFFLRCFKPNFPPLRLEPLPPEGKEKKRGEGTVSRDLPLTYFNKGGREGFLQHATAIEGIMAVLLLSIGPQGRGCVTARVRAGDWGISPSRPENSAPTSLDIKVLSTTSYHLALLLHALPPFFAAYPDLDVAQEAL